MVLSSMFLFFSLSLPVSKINKKLFFKRWVEGWSSQEGAQGDRYGPLTKR